MINYSIIYNKKVTFYKYKENVIRVYFVFYILFIYFSVRILYSLSDVPYQFRSSRPDSKLPARVP